MYSYKKKCSFVSGILSESQLFFVYRKKRTVEIQPGYFITPLVIFAIFVLG